MPEESKRLARVRRETADARKREIAFRAFRLTVRIALTVLFLGLFFFIYGGAGKAGAGGAMLMVGLAVLCALIAALLWAPMIAGACGKAFAGLVYPEQVPREVKPEYSVALARYHEGKYLEALQEYALAIEKRPRDVRARFERAEIFIDHLGNLDAAERELREALELATGAAQRSVVAHRLADLLAERRGLPDEAADILETFADGCRIQRGREAGQARLRAARLRDPGSAATREATDQPR